MTTIGDVRWGGYKEYEGAYFLGTKPFRLPSGADENHRILDVITTTEGGTADAVNAYDRCIVSVGYIQWCEASYFLTSKLLGRLASYDRRLLDPLGPALEASRAEFVDIGAGKWRFRFREPRRDVDTAVEQQQLFLLHSNGQRGTWDDDSRAHVKLWVACLANVLADERAMALQVAYTAERVTSFATPSAWALLWDGTPDTGYPGALRAAFLSFAANLPAVASKELAIAAATLGAKKWSRDWCVGVLKQLAFGPKIGIYPHRYQRIRPKLEANWGVDFPDLLTELAAFESEDPTRAGEPSFTNAVEVQELLIRLGYDLGPRGADGRVGAKTRDALMTFQGLHRLEPDGIVGPRTRQALLAAFRALA